MVPNNYDQLAALTVVVVLVTTLFVPMQVGAQGSADTIDGGEWSGTEQIDHGGNESVLERYGIDREQISRIEEQRSLPQTLQVGKTQVGTLDASSTTGVSERELPEGTLAALDALGSGDGEATVSPALSDVEGATTVVVQLAELDQAELSSSNAVTDALKTHAAITQNSIESFADGREGVTIQEQFWLTNAVILHVDTDEVSLDSLAARPGVQAVHPNFEVHALGTTANQGSGNAVAGTAASTAAGVNVTGKFTYGLEQIGVPSAWEETKGEGAQVAVLDTGVDTKNHPNLTPIEGGWAEFSAGGKQLDTEPNDGEGHGTHVSGTVVGHQTDDGVHYGVAPNADLLHGKVLNDNGGGSFASVIAGMEWATEHEADVDVMSMSLGFSGRFSERMIEPVRNARAEGITVVISSGNSGANTSASPGNVFDSFAVGASDENRDIASFSSGDTIDTSEAWGDAAPFEWPEEYVVPNVAAPGVDVLSAKAGGGFEELSGTSMAAPHVAGAAALIESANDQTAPDGVETVLESTAEKPADEPSGQDPRYGNGIINASAAVEQVEPEATINIQTGIDEAGVEISDVDGITVQTDVGFEATTNASSSVAAVSLRVPAGTHNLTAEAFGYEDETTTVTVAEGDSKTVDLSLDEPDFAVKQAASPDYVESGNTLTVTHKIAHVDEYSVLLNSEGSAPSSESLTVAGRDVQFGEDVDISDRGPIAEVNAEIETSEELFSAVDLRHRFQSVDTPVGAASFFSETKVHPSVVTVPEDVDPGVSEDEPYTKLQETIDFVVPGTTIELAHSTFETSADVPTGSESRVALALNKSLTLTAASGASPTIEVTDTGGSDSTTGIAVLGGRATISGLAVDGNGANTSVLNGGSEVTITDSSFADTETGLMNAGTNLTVTDSQFSNMTSGATFLTGAGAEVRGNTFTDVETGVTSSFLLFFPPAEISTLADNEIGGGDELTTGVVMTPLGIVDTMKDNRIAVANESGVGVRSSVGILNESTNNTITGGETGIQLSGSLSGLDTQLRGNEISNVSGTGINVTTGSTNQTIENNRIEDAGTGIRLADSSLTRLSENAVTGAAIRLTNATNTTGQDNGVQDADTGLVVTNGSTNTELLASAFDNVTDAVSIRNESANTTVAASITNQNGTISFGDVDADTNTVTDTTLMTGETSTIVDLSGSNATLAANQTPPATPFADIGTFLELRANGDSPVLSTNVSYSSSEVTDLNESSLRLHTYDGNWTPINGSTVDTDAQVVSGTITETGTFAPLDPSTPVSQDEAEDSGNESDDDSNSSGDNADDSSSKDDSSGSGGGAIGGTPLPPRNPDGDDDSGSDDSESADEGSNEPTAEISLDSGTATAGESLTVSAEASSVEGSKIVAYNWTIDDEQYGGETVTTTVEESGELRIELTVTAANDEEDSTTTTLPVETATPAGNETADDSTDETAGNDSTDSSTPGFGAIAALLGILFGLGLRRRR